MGAAPSTRSLGLSGLLCTPVSPQPVRLLACVCCARQPGPAWGSPRTWGAALAKSRRGPRGGATAGSRIRHPLAASGERSAQRHTRRVACPYVHARGFPATAPGRRGRSTPSRARAEALLAREARASPAVGARVAVGGSLLWTGRRLPIASASVFKASRCAEPLTRSP